jgi:hypothetical protein
MEIGTENLSNIVEKERINLSWDSFKMHDIGIYCGETDIKTDKFIVAFRLYVRSLSKKAETPSESEELISTEISDIYVLDRDTDQKVAFIEPELRNWILENIDCEVKLN